MKYTILINQLVLSEYPSLDIVDGAILDYLYFLHNSNHGAIVKNRITKNGNLFTWVNYQRIISDMPLLRIKDKGAISRRIKKLVEAKFVKTVREKHQKMFFRTTVGVDKLLIKNNSREKLLTQNNRAVDTEQQLHAQAVVLKQHYKDNSNKDNNDKYPPTPHCGSLGVSVNNMAPTRRKHEHAKTQTKPEQEVFQHYQKISGSNRAKLLGGRRDKIRTRLKTFSVEEIKQAISNCYADDFYSGKNDRGWRADIDYIVRNDENVEKLMLLRPRKSGKNNYGKRRGITVG